MLVNNFKTHFRKYIIGESFENQSCVYIILVNCTDPDTRISNLNPTDSLSSKEEDITYTELHLSSLLDGSDIMWIYVIHKGTWMYREYHGVSGVDLLKTETL